MAMADAATAITPEAAASWPTAMKIRPETRMAMVSYNATYRMRRRGPCRPVAAAAAGVETEEQEVMAPQCMC